MKNPNVLLITVDCLRADYLPCYGYSRIQTPHIDRLAIEGTRFYQAISHGESTPMAFPSIMASLPPPVKFSDFSDFQSLRSHMQRNPTLAEELRRHGFATAGIWVISPFFATSYGITRGFDAQYDLSTRVRKLRNYRTLRFLITRLQQLSIIRIIWNYWKYSHPWNNAAGITDMAISWLRQRDEQPWLLWLHYIDCHLPYTVHGASRSFRWNLARAVERMRYKPGSITELQRQYIVRAYEAGICMVDNQIGKLLEALNELGQLEHTVIALTADHGESFGEHGGWEHSYGHVYECNLHVPLILYGPELPQGHIVNEPVPIQDLPSTLLGIALPDNHRNPRGWLGRNLLPYLSNRSEAPEVPIFSVSLVGPFAKPTHRASAAYRLGQWKYIRYWKEGIAAGQKLREELFNLSSDPEESHNLVESADKELLIKMRTGLSEALANAAYDEKKRVADRVKVLKNLHKL
ncbi:sulfatase [Chloroflexota bacterium]